MSSLKEECYGSLPIGSILWPSAMQGLTSDGRKLKGCSPSKCSSFGPDAEMLAPESGRASVSRVPIMNEM